MSWQNFDVSGGMAPGYAYGNNYGGGGGLFGGATGGALVGGLAGSLLGNGLFGRGGNRGCGCDNNGGEKIIQVNDNGGRRGWGSEIGEWETMKELSDTRREVAVMPYIAQNTALEQTIALNQQLGATNAQIGALQMQLCQCCCETQRVELEGQYKAAMLSAGLSREMAECCCKQLQATMVMGYETQLRDQKNHGEVMGEIFKTQCLIKDTEKDSIIRAQAEKIGMMSGKLNTAEIIAAMKPVAPVPAYIQANPYENFRPTVKIANDCCDNNRWDFNNCRGFQ